MKRKHKIKSTVNDLDMHCNTVLSDDIKCGTLSLSTASRETHLGGTELLAMISVWQVTPSIEFPHLFDK